MPITWVRDDGSAINSPDPTARHRFLADGEYEKRVRSWAELVEAFLRDLGLQHRFEAAASLPEPFPPPDGEERLPFSLDGVTPAQVEAFVEAQLDALGQVIERLRDAATLDGLEGRPLPTTPAGRLNRALSEGIALRTRVVADEELWLVEDSLFSWAKRTYKILCEDFAAYADEFYGDGPSRKPEHIAWAFMYEIKAHGRDGYLDDRIDLLKRITAQQSGHRAESTK